MIALLLAVVSIGLATVIDLDQTSYVALPIGVQIELELNCEYFNQHQWQVQEFDIEGFQLLLSRRKGEKIGVKGVDTYTLYYAKCNERCQIGQSFDLTFHYRELFSDDDIEEKIIRFKVVSPPTEFL